MNDSPAAVEHKRSVAGIFHRASATYDHVGPAFFTHFGRQLVAHAALPQCARVLDAACGRGAVLFPAAEAVGTEGSVIGIDLAQGMVQSTGHEAAVRGLSHVQVLQMDAEHLDFPESTFDVVLCGFAIFFFPQLGQALSEFHRVLKPGGRLVVSTWSDRYDRDWEWFSKLADKYVPPPPRNEKDPPTAQGQPVFSTPEGMQKILSDAGFVTIHVIMEMEHFAYATKDEWWESRWSHGARRRLEAVERIGGPEALAKFKAECLQEIEQKMGAYNIRQSFEVLYSLASKPV